MNKARHVPRREANWKIRLAVLLLAALLAGAGGFAVWRAVEAREASARLRAAAGAPCATSGLTAESVPGLGSTAASNTPTPAPMPPTATPGPVKIAKPDSAVVLFTFDDGDASDYLLAYPILKQYGIRGTSYLITKFTDDGAAGKMTWDEVKEMAAYGWVFGCHSYDHRHLTKMTDGEIRQSLEEVNQSFERQGFPAPTIMAYPYGACNQRVIDDVRAYRAQGRLAYKTSFVDLNGLDPYRIPAICADMQTQAGLAGLEKTVDRACAQKAVVVFFAHALYREKPYDTVQENHTILSGSSAQTSSELFGELVQYCVGKGCAFMTMKELMDLYS